MVGGPVGSNAQGLLASDCRGRPRADVAGGPFESMPLQRRFAQAM